jgi:hypothetical protein
LACSRPPSFTAWSSGSGSAGRFSFGHSTATFISSGSLLAAAPDHVRQIR